MAETIKNSINSILEAYGDRIVTALKDNLDFNKKNASGKLKKSIVFKIKFLGDSYVFELYLEDYYKWVDGGRGATVNGGGGRTGQPLDWGKQSLRRDILKWMMYKRITPSAMMGKGKNKAAGKISIASDLRAARSMAYLISRKIHKQGYKGSGFFSNVFKAGGVGDITELERELSEALKRDVKVELQIV